MPYDVVGNGAGRSTNQAARDLGLDRNRNSNHRHQHHHTNYHGNNNMIRPRRATCAMFDIARTIFFFFFIGGGIMVFMGVSKLVSSTTDSRGKLLATWSADVSAWTSSSTFTKLNPTLTTSLSTVMTGMVVVLFCLLSSSSSSVFRPSWVLLLLGMFA
jgi:hypothetical protein